MKKYRLTKRYVDRHGEVYEPQDLIQQEDGTYFIEPREGQWGIELSHYCKPQAMIEAGYDGIEEIKPKRWRAEDNERYYYVNDCFEIDWHSEAEDSTDDKLHEYGNYFRTKKQAEAVMEKIRKLLQEEQDKIMEEDNE